MVGESVAISQVVAPSKSEKKDNSNTIVIGEVSNELVFAVVGHLGSGTSKISNKLEQCLTSPQLEGGKFETFVLKARVEIEHWASSLSQSQTIDQETAIERVSRLQDWGDKLRRSTDDNSAVARRLIQKIRHIRAEKQGVSAENQKGIVPDGTRRAYILDSIRHPAEVHLLRTIYQDAFTLIGVVCDEEIRKERIQGKLNIGPDDAERLIKRDSKAPEKYGQRVADAFHLSDFFVDNTEDEKFVDDGGIEQSNPDWDIADHLNRLVEIITHAKIVRPTASETAMYYADAARLRSSCLSRQVGAALVNDRGNIVATGTNEVPRAQGGVYGASFEFNENKEDVPPRDERCACQGMCKNNARQGEIVHELLEIIGKAIGTSSEYEDYISYLANELEAANVVNSDAQSQNTKNIITKLMDIIGRSISESSGDGEGLDGLAKTLQKSSIGGILEFSRAVHAEMDALLSAGREGIPTDQTRLFVTTFPCHYCARHVVAAGIKEVRFIEPYLKSKAIALHSDSIATTLKQWRRDKNKVRFLPFVGVAPRAYRRAFLKDREYKDDFTGILKIQDPTWGSPWKMLKTSYVDLEAKLLEKTTE